MPKLPAEADLSSAHMSMVVVRSQPDGNQITRLAFVADVIDGSQSTLNCSIDFAKNYLEAAGWRCSETVLTTEELNTQSRSLRQLLNITDKNLTDFDDSETRGSADTSNSWDTTRASAWALQNLS